MKLKSFHDETISFRLLFWLILGLLVFTPLLPSGGILHIVMNLFYTIVFFVVVRMLSRNPIYAILAGISGIVLVVTLWIQFLYSHEVVLIVGRIGGAIFFSLTVASLLQYITESETVTRNVLFSAMVAYLMLGILFSFIYNCIFILEPASFELPAAMATQMWVFIYFSFVTLTTLGYGDISPLTELSGAVAIVEAIIGQFYLVVVVAWLVGMHVARKTGNSSKED